MHYRRTGKFAKRAAREDQARLAAASLRDRLHDPRRGGHRRPSLRQHDLRRPVPLARPAPQGERELPGRFNFLDVRSDNWNRSKLHAFYNFNFTGPIDTENDIPDPFTQMPDGSRSSSPKRWTKSTTRTPAPPSPDYGKPITVARHERHLPALVPLVPERHRYGHPAASRPVFAHRGAARGLGPGDGEPRRHRRLRRGCRRTRPAAWGSGDLPAAGRADPRRARRGRGAHRRGARRADDDRLGDDPLRGMPDLRADLQRLRELSPGGGDERPRVPDAGAPLRARIAHFGNPPCRIPFGDGVRRPRLAAQRSLGGAACSTTSVTSSIRWRAASACGLRGTGSYLDKTSTWYAWGDIPQTSASSAISRTPRRPTGATTPTGSRASTTTAAPRQRARLSGALYERVGRRGRPDFNLDGDRGYGHLCWNHRRSRARLPEPARPARRPDEFIR